MIITKHQLIQEGVLDHIKRNGAAYGIGAAGLGAYAYMNPEMVGLGDEDEKVEQPVQQHQPNQPVQQHQPAQPNQPNQPAQPSTAVPASSPIKPEENSFLGDHYGKIATGGLGLAALTYATNNAPGRYAAGLAKQGFNATKDYAVDKAKSAAHTINNSQTADKFRQAKEAVNNSSVVNHFRNTTMNGTSKDKLNSMQQTAAKNSFNTGRNGPGNMRDNVVNAGHSFKPSAESIRTQATNALQKRKAK